MYMLNNKYMSTVNTVTTVNAMNIVNTMNRERSIGNQRQCINNVPRAILRYNHQVALKHEIRRKMAFAIGNMISYDNNRKSRNYIIFAQLNDKIISVDADNQPIIHNNNIGISSIAICATLLLQVYLIYIEMYSFNFNIYIKCL